MTQNASTGDQTTNVYDNCGRTIKQTVNQKVSRAVYDSNGRITQSISWSEYDASKDGLNDSTPTNTYRDLQVGTRYYYGTNGKLSKMEMSSYSTNFESSGELSNVKVGTQTLVSYSYSNDVSKLLTQTQYGNNQTINYTYNSAGKIATIKFNNDTTPAFEYTYNTNGDLSEKTDNINNLKTVFSDNTVTISRMNTDGTTTFLNSYQTTTADGVNKFIETIGNNIYTTQFLENKDKFILNDTTSFNKEYTYNADQKVTANNIYKQTGDTNSSILATAYNYELTGKKRLTGIKNTYTGTNSQYQYTYDSNDNIQTVTKNGVQTKYYYDSLNELIRVDDGDQNKTFTYSYDFKGNILSKSEYALIYSETLPQAVSTINYAYGDSNWGDKLTSYNGNAITYDEIGNPLSYNGWAFTWQSGRQLKAMSKDGTSVSYKYDDSGIRTSKTVNGVTTNYTTIDGRITSQSDGTNMLYFRYDKNNELFGAQINGAEYIYVKNLQGDIVSILDTNGTSVVDYTYDAWGKAVSITGSMADTIGQLNPMRYRGYYYDNESGYYYLQSRYYDASICRFINADEPSILVASNGQLLFNNMFAYCGNDPINMRDNDGMRPNYLTNSSLLNAQHIPWYSRAKAIYSVAYCLNIIYKYDNIIIAYARQFSISSDMIRAVLYRELMCYGIDDILADNAVRNYYTHRSIFNYKDDSSTGLAQIFASTAIKAEQVVLKYNTTNNKWVMWNKLQDPSTNIYYCAMVLKMEQIKLGYRIVGTYDIYKIQAIFSAYNGKSSYGWDVLYHYVEFIKG